MKVAKPCCAQALADFGELNARLTEGGFFGARRFQIKRGDLTVGDELRARNVELVVDGGSLTVNGRIDASGPQVGSIRLAAMGDRSSTARSTRIRPRCAWTATARSSTAPTAPSST